MSWSFSTVPFYKRTTHESSRTTPPPPTCLLFRLGKILIYINTDYHKLRFWFHGTLCMDWPRNFQRQISRGSYLHAFDCLEQWYWMINVVAYTCADPWNPTFNGPFIVSWNCEVFIIPVLQGFIKIPLLFCKLSTFPCILFCWFE